MTAVNILKTTDAVHILTDGMASSLFAGQVGLLPKCLPVPHLDAAIVTRGGGALLHTLGTALIIRSRDFADLVGATGRLQSIAGDVSTLWGQALGEFDIFVAGIGKTGPQAFLVSNHNRQGFAPWEVFEIPQFLATPPPGQDLFDSVFSADDPVAEMPRLVDAQRADPSVGGFAQLTSIEPGGISTRIVRDYR